MNSLFQNQVYVLFGLARLPTETPLVFFLSQFLKRNGSFSFFLPLVPTQCLDKTFCILSFAQSRKISSKFSKPFRHFKTQNQSKCENNLGHLFRNIACNTLQYLLPDCAKILTVFTSTTLYYIVVTC